jgi:SAM-dependent methyltransferase
MKTFLHVGCGAKTQANTTRVFASTADWTELRFDIDPAVKPDIEGTILDMSGVRDASVDAVFSSHNIEHVYPHEVPLALKEFLRVLSPDGILVLTCPDLKSVATLIADDKLTEPAYESPAGPIAPLDILYGFRPSLAQGNLYMAHKCGFTAKVLQGTLLHAGFRAAALAARPHPFYDLWAIASKASLVEDDVKALAIQHFPR